MLAAPVAAHPMDEWFTEMHWTNGQGLKGRFRVPADQRAKLSQQPIVFHNGTEALTVTFSDAGVDENGRVLVDMSAPSSQPAAEVAIALPAGLLDDNQSLVGFLAFDGGDPTTVMVPAGQTRTVSPPTSGVSASAGAPDIGAFFRFGLKHILEGFDHLLFLFCLLIAGGTLRHLVIVVTAFTVGHSITLALSVLGLISLNSTLIESLIALSIVLAALSNLRPPKDDSEESARKTALSRGAMALGFGLIHGMGFASMLLENGLSGTGVVAPLLGFNLGVEAGAGWGGAAFLSGALCHPSLAPAATYRCHMLGHRGVHGRLLAAGAVGPHQHGCLRLIACDLG
jgi:hypothetical protein